MKFALVWKAVEGFVERMAASELDLMRSTAIIHMWLEGGEGGQTMNGNT